MLRAPRHLPSLEMILADLGMPQRVLAQHLGVTERALRKWKAAGEAPRAVLLALFWETSWGRSTADTDAYNAALIDRQRADAYERENRRLAAAMRRMDAMEGETVNSPAFYRA